MQIQELGLGGSVKLPGFASNLPEEINKAAMYISTSNHEGISNSMLEALGMGIPTIVTDCPVGGSKMFVHTGDNENKRESLLRNYDLYEYGYYLSLIHISEPTRH